MAAIDKEKDPGGPHVEGERRAADRRRRSRDARAQVDEPQAGRQRVDHEDRPVVDGADAVRVGEERAAVEEAAVVDALPRACRGAEPAARERAKEARRGVEDAELVVHHVRKV